ncbi:DUF3325 domain-containing protein [Sphingomonas sp.]|uniref:DUF3325 domain-containing protein n=1 Tax=Sphingomonas sp. TaxID=28214 RepID=UPI003D6D24EF
MTAIGYLVSLLLATTGFVLLCLSNQRHQRVMAGRMLGPRASSRLKWSGFGLIALAYVASWITLGGAHGTVVLVGELTLAASLTIALLAARGRA